MKRAYIYSRLMYKTDIMYKLHTQINKLNIGKLDSTRSLKYTRKIVDMD